MKKIKVSEQERDEIQDLFERNNSLNELNICLNYEQNKEYIYLKKEIEKDIDENIKKMDNWWNKTLRKYNIGRNKRCVINFDNCEIVENND